MNAAAHTVSVIVVISMGYQYVMWVIVGMKRVEPAFVKNLMWVLGMSM